MLDDVLKEEDGFYNVRWNLPGVSDDTTRVNKKC